MLKKIFLFIICVSCTNVEEEKSKYDQVDFISFEHQELIPTLTVDSLEKTIDLYKSIWGVMKKYDHIAPNRYLRINYNDTVYYTNNNANHCISTGYCCPKTTRFYFMEHFTSNTVEEIIRHFNSVEKARQNRKIIAINFDNNTSIDQTLKILKQLESEYKSGKLKGYPFNVELIPTKVEGDQYDTNISDIDFEYDSIGTEKYLENLYKEDRLEAEKEKQELNDMRMRYRQELKDEFSNLKKGNYKRQNDTVSNKKFRYINLRRPITKLFLGDMN
ncbi:hypothetical protein [Flammeovirga aprica]|uniref:Uncharacterized protein n=1 Tax=Flammeovirga aprica JL-4 TaxID=694437 RepID=A0A7X9XD54_9BACT|nr:hypothetical protein [Flammeovirga aprica]NME72445.1 hypothetical protein [Flammeovirga aprica JL-4]